MAKDHIHILGGGPAGASAALAALSEGALVRVIERPSVIANPFRHKVCGEFFSPEIETDLLPLGVWNLFQAESPARVQRMVLHFGKHSKAAPLSNPAWGLSRYRFDALMLAAARSAGAQILARSGTAEPVQIVATGRQSSASSIPRGERLFGFKTHFRGPQDDAVELFFFNGCYLGVSPIEGGFTNVCGLGPESELKRIAFHYDELIGKCPALRSRLDPLQRSLPWISTGPLHFQQKLEEMDGPDAPYFAGDALSFVDPFTGSGLLAAVRSGALAGRAAAQGKTRKHFLTRSQASLQKPFQIARVLRLLIRSGWAERLIPAIPAQLLFAITRPR